MNIIDAWKAAKEGQKISRGMGELLKHPGKNIAEFINKYCLSSEALLSDCWEVVKTYRREEMTMQEFRVKNGLVSTDIPNDAKIVITWEE